MNFNRADALRRLASEDFDLLVIGGGITGSGVALDAATRGLRVALVDKGDFAAGTSSKSSKLVHGGIRYLQQKEVGLVYEALAERQILRSTAPHLVRVLPFLLPVFTRDGLLPGKLARILGATMWAYDLTGGLRIGKLHKRVSKEEALTYMPTLPVDRLAASYIYYDAQADDARLTLAVAQTAADFGAAVANYAQLVGLEKDDAGHVEAARVRAGDEEFVVRARTIVNATGVWADDVRAIDEGRHPDTIRPAKGIHITVPWALVRNQIAAVVPVPKDRRSVFVVPWGDRGDGEFSFTYIGTTDTDYEGPLDDPQCTPDDIAYLLRAINASVTTQITDADVLGTWAGLRPLVRDAGSERTADLSRRHSVLVAPSRVVTVTGGKLTTYRRMAADAVDEIMKMLELGGRSRTKKVKLHGATGWDAPDLPAPFNTRYGGDARSVLALARAEHDLGEPIVSGLDYVRAEVIHAARNEMALTVDDILSRRTRARLLARDASADAADDVAALMAAELGWDATEQRRQVEHYRALVREEQTAAGLPATALDALLREPS
jgi:glycerol-3-phosphate dehydrogenase